MDSWCRTLMLNACLKCSKCRHVVWGVVQNFALTLLSMLPWLLCLGWRFRSLARCRWTLEWVLCCSCFNYTHKNTPYGVSVCHYLDWHRDGSILHSCALRWFMVSFMLLIAVSPITQPHMMTSKIRAYLILLTHTWYLHLDRMPTSQVLLPQLKMKLFLRGVGRLVTNNGLKSFR